MITRPYVLSVAGFDPSGGAGVLADVKTFEAHDTLGLSVCTAITVQNDVKFESCEWLDFRLLKAQIKCLFERFEIQVVKIGVVQSWMALSRIISYLREFNPSVRIVLDPVLKATADFDFHKKENVQFLDDLLASVEVITPNYEEAQRLYENKTIEEALEHMRSKTNVFLKGGHNPEKKGTDMLYVKGEQGAVLVEPSVNKVFDKHGTGCVLSSSLASSLAKGKSLTEAAVEAKRYTEVFMNSNESLLGYHKL